ncbi:MAG: hypothetical protein U0T81_12400 [Saprospiraceae bacterium]
MAGIEKIAQRAVQSRIARFADRYLLLFFNLTRKLFFSFPIL